MCTHAALATTTGQATITANSACTHVEDRGCRTGGGGHADVSFIHVYIMRATSNDRVLPVYLFSAFYDVIGTPESEAHAHPVLSRKNVLTRPVWSNKKEGGRENTQAHSAECHTVSLPLF